MLGKANQIKTLRVVEQENGFDYHMAKALEQIGNAEVLQITTHVYENSDYPNYHFMNALIVYKEV